MEPAGPVDRQLRPGLPAALTLVSALTEAAIAMGRTTTPSSSRRFVVVLVSRSRRVGRSCRLVARRARVQARSRDWSISTPMRTDCGRRRSRCPPRWQFARTAASSPGLTSRAATGFPLSQRARTNGKSWWTTCPCPGARRMVERSQLRYWWPHLREGLPAASGTQTKPRPGSKCLPSTCVSLTFGPGWRTAWTMPITLEIDTARALAIALSPDCSPLQRGPQRRECCIPKNENFFECQKGSVAHPKSRRVFRA